jgi:hypothetical protein
MYYGGSANVPGAPGNPGFFPSVGYSPLVAGGRSLKDLLPNAQWDIPAQQPSQYLKPGAKPSLKQMFPVRPGTYGANPNDPFERHIPAANSAFLDNTEDSSFIAGSPSFDINPNKQPAQPGVGPQIPNMYMPTQILDPRMRQQRMEESIPTTAVRMAGLMPGMTPMGNAGFYAGPQLGQTVPPGFQNKIVS